MKSQRTIDFVDFIKGIVIVSALAVLDHFIFMRWFHTTHVTWYLKNGATIGLVTTLASMAWGDLNKNTRLISSHPLKYFRANLQLVGLPIFVMGTHLRSKKDHSVSRSLWDTLVTLPLVLIFVSFMVLWLVVVAPLQYFVYLVCGAPARLLGQSDQRTIATMHDGNLEVGQVGKNDIVPAGWWDASISAKPVAITNLFTTLFFVILKFVSAH